MRKNVNIRDPGDIKIIDLKGKITIGAGDLQMREAIHEDLASGAGKLLVNLKEVTTIDSTGIGELVGCYTTASKKGAELKLVNLPEKITDVLMVTKLITVFTIFADEEEAIKSFGG